MSTPTTHWRRLRNAFTSTLLHRRPLTRERSRDLGPPILFLALSAAFLWRPLATNQIPFPMDLVASADNFWATRPNATATERLANPVLWDVALQYFPNASYAMERLSRGEFPLWNPYILGGTPFFAAMQAAVLDPINLSTYPAGLYAHWVWAAWLRLAILGLGTYAWARSLGRSVLAAVCAGIVFMTCGFVAVWLHTSVVTTLTWMPALFWAATRLLQTGRPIWTIVSALTAAGLLVGGHPETALLAGLSCAGYAVAFALVSRRPPVESRGMIWRLTLLGGAAALGLALAAIQILPAVELLLHSAIVPSRFRGNPLDADGVETLLRVTNLFSPGITSTLANINGWPRIRADLTVQAQNFSEQVSSIGALAFAIVVIGAVYWVRRDRLVLVLAGAAGMALNLSVQGPGWALVTELSLANVAQGVRFGVLWSFFGAILVAYGIDAIMMAGSRRWLGRAALVVLTVIMVAAVTLIALQSVMRAALWERALRGLSTPVLPSALFDLTNPSIAWPMFIFAAGFAALVARWRGWISARMLGVAACGLMYAEAWSFGSVYHPITPRDAIFPRNPVTRLLQQELGHERFSAAPPAFLPNAGMLFGLRDVRGYEDLIDEQFKSLYFPGDDDLQAGIGRDFMRDTTYHRLLQIGAVRYLLRPRETRPPTNAHYEWLFDDRAVSVYENQDVLPRAYTMTNAVFATNAPAAIGALLDPAHDPRQAVVLVGSPISAAAPTSTEPLTPVVWRVDEPERLEFDVELQTPGYLVVSDTFAPGWEATVDGQPTPILRANAVYRAVAVPAGQHAIVFAYRPGTFTLGLVLSSVAAAFTIVFVVQNVVRTQRRRHRGPLEEASTPSC